MDRRQVLGALAIGAASIRELFAGTFGSSSNRSNESVEIVHLRPGEQYSLPNHPSDGTTLTFILDSGTSSAQSLILPGQNQMIMGDKDPLEIDTHAHFNLRYEKVTRCWMFYLS